MIERQQQERRVALKMAMREQRKLERRRKLIRNIQINDWLARYHAAREELAK